MFNLGETQGGKGAVSSTHTSPLPKASQAILGAGLPPVPSKLVRRIECGEFIELSELLPEKLSFDVAEEDSGKGKSKKKLITSILEWVQCFSLYTHRGYPTFWVTNR